MGRPRGFDEQTVVQTAVTLFAGRPYDALSIDDLVTHLAVHRNSLYKTFGSKRGLYLTALRWHVEHEIGPLLAEIGRTGGVKPALDFALGFQGGSGLDLIVLAAADRAPVDAEVAKIVSAVFADLDQALAQARGDDQAAGADLDLTAVLLGRRLRGRAAAGLSST